MASWRSGTAKQYRTYLSRWESYCDERNIDKLQPGIENALDFLTDLFHSVIGYSTINTARSALSTVIVMPNGSKFGEHPVVCRFLKGVFELRPSLPKYTEIWDVAKVLEYLKTLSPAKELSLKMLTKKVTMLLCLLTGQRCQTVHSFDIRYIQQLPDKFRIAVRELLKHTKPGKHQEPFSFTAFSLDKRLCIVEYLSAYISKTEKLRGTNNTRLLISYIKLHKPVSKSTVARWIKSVLRQSGIDVSRFSAHSCRSASTSFTKQSRLNLIEIMKSAGWSNARTFAAYYEKPILTESFSTKLLE